MKKIFIALSLLVVFNCEDDLTNKTPVFQATVNGNNQWIAEDFIATIQNNQLSISGTNPFGVISFVVNLLTSLIVKYLTLSLVSKIKTAPGFLEA